MPISEYTTLSRKISKLEGMLVSRLNSVNTELANIKNRMSVQDAVESALARQRRRLYGASVAIITVVIGAAGVIVSTLR